MVTLFRSVGDTRTAIGATLYQRNTSGSLTVVDVSDLTLYFKMITSAGVTKVAKTSNYITIVSGSDGQVQYTLQDDDVDTAGLYYAWFMTENTDSDLDTYPSDGRTFRVIFFDSEGDS